MKDSTRQKLFRVSLISAGLIPVAALTCLISFTFAPSGGAGLAYGYLSITIHSIIGAILGAVSILSGLLIVKSRRIVLWWIVPVFIGFVFFNSPVYILIREMLVKPAQRVRQMENIQQFWGDTQSAVVMQGTYLGHVERDQTQFRKYHFVNDSGKPPEGSIQVLVPLEIGTRSGGAVPTAYFERAPRSVTGHDHALLILASSRHSLNPALHPREYFETYFPDLRWDELTDHTLIVCERFLSRSRLVVPGNNPPPSSTWQDCNLIIDYKSFVYAAH